MNDGVAMLLERMKTHPEEFVDGVHNGENRWGHLMNEYRGYLPKEDLEVFDKAHREAIFEYMRQRFTQKVMEELIDPEQETANLKLLREIQDIRKLRIKATAPTPIAGVTQTL